MTNTRYAALCIWFCVFIVLCAYAQTHLSSVYRIAEGDLADYKKMEYTNTYDVAREVASYEITLDSDLCSSLDHPEYMNEIEACRTAKDVVDKSHGSAQRRTYVGMGKFVDERINVSKLVVVYGNRLANIRDIAIQIMLVSACCVFWYALMCIVHMIVFNDGSRSSSSISETRARTTTTTTTVVTASVTTGNGDGDGGGNLSLDPNAGRITNDRDHDSDSDSDGETWEAGLRHKQRRQRGSRNRGTTEMTRMGRNRCGLFTDSITIPD